MGNRLAAVRALIVDDDRDNVELLELLLAGEGATVRAAKGAVEALSMAEEWTPDILLIDLSLPDIDGYELLKRLRAKPALGGVPAVAVSGHALEDDKRRTNDAGFVLHVTKPFDFEALALRLATLVAASGSTFDA